MRIEKISIKVGKEPQVYADAPQTHIDFDG